MKIPFTIESVNEGTAHACAENSKTLSGWCWCCMKHWPCRDAERKYTKELENMVERMVELSFIQSAS